MKKIKKITAVVLMLAALLSLSGCAQLDELREKQAFFNENGIIYKDTLYKTISIDNQENIISGYAMQKNLNVTDPGVPVLASLLIGWEFYSTNDDETIITGGYDNELYVREDKYDLYMDSLKNGICFTDLGINYFDFELGKSVDYIFTESEKQAVLSLLSTEPVEPEFYDYLYDELFLFEQSDNALFRKRDSYSIVCSEGPGAGDSYYLVVYDNDEEYMWEISAVYRSTPQTDALFKSFFEKCGNVYYY